MLRMKPERNADEMARAQKLLQTEHDVPMGEKACALAEVVIEVFADVGMRRGVQAGRGTRHLCNARNVACKAARFF